MKGKNRESHASSVEESTNLQRSSYEDFAKSLVENEDLVYLGLVDLHAESRFESFEKWIAEKKHGEMSYLERYHELRKEPQLIVPGAQHAIIIGLPYYLGDKYRFHSESVPRIAQYARFADYHKTLKKKGEHILNRLLEYAPGHFGRVLVDSTPILERALAERALKGFIGKNTMFISPQSGSYLLLCEIFLSIPLTSSLSQEKLSSCGTCSRCQVYCPTGALTPYSLDATKCLSYYTIEHRGVIPVKYWKYLKQYVFGCDICQLVCPFNRKAETTKHLAVKIAEFPPLFEVATMNSAYYEKTFGGTPLTRAKKSGLRRNALIAMIVMKDPKLKDAIEHIQNDDDSLLKETLEQIPEYEKTVHE